MRDPGVGAVDPIAVTLSACHEHHGETWIGALERALESRQQRGLASSGEPQTGRALRRTATLARLRLDPPTLIASALALTGDRQPTARPEQLDALDLSAELRAEVVALISGVERLAAIHWDALDEESAESLRTMFVAMAADVRVVLITLCDRLEVVRELRSVEDPAARRRIATETRDVFAPLANRLGIWQLKWELEDLALRELEPEVYADIKAKLASTRSERHAAMAEVVEVLGAELDKAGMVVEVNGRPKHITSIVKKMRRKGLRFEEIYDINAVRVILESDSPQAGKRDCYAALGVVHGLWSPVTGEFDDYIARPKPNGYQSLHTAVIGRSGGRPLEVQIRTREMHLFGEYGVAAHWAYKEGRRDASKAERFNLLRQLVDWQKQLVDPRELAEALKTDLFEDQVHVFTPAGDVIALPEGATPLDFAYRIHTDVGHRSRGAKVNGVMVSLNHTLKTGDRVEILKKKRPEPSRDWLSPHLGYLHTGSAKQKVRQWFRAQDRDEAVLSGREALERELTRAGVGAVDLPDLDALALAHDFKTGDDLLAAIGFGDLNPQGLAAEILERLRPAPEPEPEPIAARPNEAARDATGVSIGGVAGILSQPARCCSPVPGDNVVGWVSRGRGIMIHRRDCPNIVHNQEPERILEIDWGRHHRSRYPVKLSLEVVDRPGVLRDIAEIVSTMGINMRATHSSRSKKRPGTQTLTLELEVDQATQIIRALGRLEGLPAVISARRVAG